MIVPRRSWERESRTVRMKRSGRGYSRNSRNEDGWIQLVISDGQTSIQQAVETAFLYTTRQMCSVHYTRGVRNTPRKHQKGVTEGLKEAYRSEQTLQDLAENQNTLGYRKAANKVEQFLSWLMGLHGIPQR